MKRKCLQNHGKTLISHVTTTLLGYKATIPLTVTDITMVVSVIRHKQFVISSAFCPVCHSCCCCTEALRVTHCYARLIISMLSVQHMDYYISIAATQVLNDKPTIDDKK